MMLVTAESSAPQSRVGYRPGWSQDCISDHQLTGPSRNLWPSPQALEGDGERQAGLRANEQNSVLGIYYLYSYVSFHAFLCLYKKTTYIILQFNFSLKML